MEKNKRKKQQKKCLLQRRFLTIMSIIFNDWEHAFYEILFAQHLSYKEIQFLNPNAESKANLGKLERQVDLSRLPEISRIHA